MREGVPGGAGAGEARLLTKSSHSRGNPFRLGGKFCWLATSHWSTRQRPSLTCQPPSVGARPVRHTVCLQVPRSTEQPRLVEQLWTLLCFRFVNVLTLLRSR